jgi:phytoene synthase
MKNTLLLLRSGFATAERITKKYAKTFYFASLFLAREKRKAAYCVYAICRITDECVDSQVTCPEDMLVKLKSDIESAYGPGLIYDGLLSAFRDSVSRYNIPKEYFFGLIEGVRMDLSKTRYANFDELYEYSYKVAGLVGLMMLKIFGSSDEKAKEYATKLGVAMQLTNIIRDIKEDWQRGRIYLPLDEMEQFMVSEKSLSTRMVDRNFKDLLKFQISRARQYYADAAPGIKMINNSGSRFVIRVMKDLYAGILNAIENNDYDVFTKRAYVNTADKLRIILKG